MSATPTREQAEAREALERLQKGAARDFGGQIGRDISTVAAALSLLVEREAERDEALNLAENDVVTQKGRADSLGEAYEEAEAELETATARVVELEAALDLVDTPYPLDVFPERTDEQRDAIFAAMRDVDKYATEWFYAHVARERGRVAREALSGTQDAQ